MAGAAITITVLTPLAAVNTPGIPVDLAHGAAVERGGFPCACGASGGGGLC